jgi:carbonic anhydrase
MTLSRTRIRFFVPLLLAAGLIAGGCSGSGSNDDDDQDPIWNYTPGPVGPAAWGSLSPDFAVCGTGQAQSPIDITVDPEGDASQLSFDYRTDGLDIENDGHKLVIHTSPVNDVQLAGIEYDLTSIHFHVPGEHRLNGNGFDGEVHFVHESADGSTAIVAVWMAAGGLNKVLSTVLDPENLPLNGGDRVTDLSIGLDLEALLPEDRSYYHYAGSLSEPPCTEGVEWYVLRSTLAVGSGQLTFLRNTFGENARPLQALNGRPITQLD